MPRKFFTLSNTRAIEARHAQGAEDVPIKIGPVAADQELNSLRAGYKRLH